MRHGVDLVRIDRVERTLAEQPGFLDRAFAPEEIACARSMSPQRKMSFLAGRFAAKEAFLKAVGATEHGAIDLRTIVVERAPSGAPVLVLRNEAQAAVERLGYGQGSVSIGHEDGLALAFVCVW